MNYNVLLLDYSGSALLPVVAYRHCIYNFVCMYKYVSVALSGFVLTGNFQDFIYIIQITGFALQFTCRNKIQQSGRHIDCYFV